MTLAQARAVLKVHEEITFVGAQEFAGLTDDDLAAWTELVRQSRIIATNLVDGAVP